ncbi:MAG: hypothetical protein Q8K65_08225 [Alphaproteobacteria bacterium]|nr:hypothetical protein [Alphaproteobacteria bacterium]
MKKQTLAAAVIACLMLAGCGEEGGIKKALQEEFEQPLCMEVGRKIPFTVAISGPYVNKQQVAWLDVLVKEKLLEQVDTKTRGSGFLAVVEGTFDVTSKGKKIQKDNELCYGKTKMLELVEYTEPQDKGGMKIVQAEVRIKHDITEKWANDPVFKNRVESGEETVSAFLTKTNKGWRVE